MIENIKFYMQFTKIDKIEQIIETLLKVLLNFKADR